MKFRSITIVRLNDVASLVVKIIFFSILVICMVLLHNADFSELDFADDSVAEPVARPF